MPRAKGMASGEARSMLADPRHEPFDVTALVRGASRDELSVLWQRHTRHPPPAGLSRRLLEFAAAWQLQAERYGGLSSATQRQLKRAIAELAGASGQASARAASRRRSARPRPAPGTRLIREWGGRTHVVDVTETGVTYNGQPYRSLSEVARAITGARWSGPRFFGLDRTAQG